MGLYGVILILLKFGLTYIELLKHNSGMSSSEEVYGETWTIGSTLNNALDTYEMGVHSVIPRLMTFIYQPTTGNLNEFCLFHHISRYEDRESRRPLEASSH